MYNRAAETADDGYLKQVGEWFTISTDTRDMQEAIADINALNDFLNGDDVDDVHEEYSVRYGFKPSVDNKRFWEEHFGLNEEQI